jgi:hypothetical protein
VLDPEIVFAVDGAVVLAIDLEEAERRARRMSLSSVVGSRPTVAIR